MEGTYPLLLDGTQAGEVRVSVQGGWTVFEASCAAQPGVVRISVYGAGREGYLGVLAPDGEALTLRRRLSRSELRSFPTEIEYAARAGKPLKSKSEHEPELQPVGRADPGAPPAEPETPPESEEQNAAPPEADADLYWYATTDGALVAFDGEQNLLALPSEDARIPADGCGEPRTIGGWDYVVFRKKT